VKQKKTHWSYLLAIMSNYSWFIYHIVTLVIIENSGYYKFMIEGSLEIKLPTIWTDEKQRWEESEKRREEKRREESDEK